MEAVCTLEIHHAINHALSRLYTRNFQDKNAVSLNGFREFLLRLLLIKKNYQSVNKKLRNIRQRVDLVLDWRGCPSFMGFSVPPHESSFEIAKIRSCHFYNPSNYDTLDYLTEHEMMVRKELYTVCQNNSRRINSGRVYSPVVLQCDGHVTEIRSSGLLGSQLLLTEEVMDLVSQFTHIKHLEFFQILSPSHKSDYLSYTNLGSLPSSLISLELSMIVNEEDSYPYFISQFIPLLTNLRILGLLAYRNSNITGFKSLCLFVFGDISLAFNWENSI